MKYMLPWMVAHVENTMDTFGRDLWQYGFAENKETLEVFLRYHHEQGLSDRLLTPEELFAPECLESFVIGACQLSRWPPGTQVESAQNSV